MDIRSLVISAVCCVSLLAAPVVLAERTVGEIMDDLKAAQAAGDDARVAELAREMQAMANSRRGDTASTIEAARNNAQAQQMQQGFQNLYQQQKALGETPEFRISIAARKGDLAAVKAIKAEGADINRYSLQPSPPLFEAIDNGHHDIVAWLLENGAKMHIEGGVVALDALRLAVIDDEDNSTMIRFLVEKGAALDQSSATFTSRMVARDKDDGDNPQNISSNQFGTGSALWTAIDKRKYRHARTLLELGASPDSFGSGSSALTLAARRHDDQAVALLLEYKADVNLKGPHKTTALSEAERVSETPQNRERRARVIQMLREAGAE